MTQEKHKKEKKLRSKNNSENWLVYFNQIISMFFKKTKFSLSSKWEYIIVSIL